MSKLKRLIAISKRSKKEPEWMHKDIFRILRKDELWVSAYEKIRVNKGLLTHAFESEKLKRLQEKVCSEKYKFQPTGNDKIVQEVMRMILEAIYDPVFSNLSFGFRTGLGSHDALNHVEDRFRWVDYVVERDIEQAYSTIDHHILVNILNKRIDDPRFIRLVWKFLGCGVLDQKYLQGSIVSPVLANIYYHELDNFVMKLKEAFEAPESKINKVSKNRIEYVRYGYDWMIGVSGDRKLALQIQEFVANFMKNVLAQPIKTKVTNLRTGNARFLGYNLFLPKNRPISEYKGKGVKTIPHLRFDVPVNKLTEKYAERGYFKKLPKGVRPTSRASYTVLEDHVIVSHYRKIWLGLLNYYSGCTNRGRLQYIHYLFHMSCAMTLGHRHRKSCSKIFRKYGKKLRVSIPHTKATVEFPYKTSWKIKERKWLLCKDRVTYVTTRENALI